MTWLAQTFRMLLVAVVTAVVIIGVLAFAFGDQTQQEQATADETRRGVLAQVCVLALPIDEGGRDQIRVEACLARYGLEP